MELKHSLIIQMMAIGSLCSAQTADTTASVAVNLDTVVVAETVSNASSKPSKPIDRIRHRLHRMDREIKKLTFIPKGTWMCGASISYNEYDFDNINILVIKDISAEGYTFGVSPFAGYFFKDNVACGLRFNYNRSMLDLGNLELNLGDDFNINLKNISYLEHDYQVSAFLRTYMSLGRSKIFGFFSEMRLTYGYSQARSTTGRYSEGTLDGTYATTNTLHLGFAPGLTAFVQDWMAVEVQMGIMGFGFKWQDQTINQVEQGHQSSFTGKFKIDLFSISIGSTLYL